MLKNYLLLAFKNFRKQKMFSMINLLGLTVGITCCLMIFLFIMNELSYDSFHKNAKNIYRVMRTGNLNGELAEIPYLSPPYATALLNDYPSAVKKVVRVYPDNDLVTYKNIAFNEKSIYLADSNFFSFFDFKLIKGDPASVLRDPTSIVMTASAAKKYFGNEDPIGKVVSFNEKLNLKVTGIAEDVPVNSHLQFDMVVPIMNFSQAGWFNQWPSNSLFVYAQLNPATNPEQLQKQFPQFMDKYMGKFYAESGFKMGLIIKPLDKIYFETASRFDNVKHGSKTTVSIFMSIALLILVIACINFMNLATARATDRSKEVGLRKVMGAVRKQLIFQFILESLIFAIVASIVSLVLLQLLMPYYTSLLGYKLPSYWNNPLVYGFVGGIILVIGLLAGCYPALLLSSFSPIEALKGKLTTGQRGSTFRKALVVFQFGISVLLIASITVIVSQMSYVRNKDLGFNREASVIVKLDNGAIWDKRVSFKNRLLADPAIASVSLMSGEPGGFHDTYTFEAEGKPGEKLMMNTEYADFEYTKTLGLKIIAGRELSAAYPSDSNQSVIINRKAAETLGYTPGQAIGKWVKNVVVDSMRRTIVGVVEDYHYASLKEPIGPLVISTNDDRRLALIRVKTSDLQATIKKIGTLYAESAGAFPFEYSFLDDKLEQLYNAETRQETILSIFSVIAIGIACLGLFGLASYTAVKRTKEIGVRKVLGSSVPNIIILLSKDLLKPVLLGSIIGIPVAYYFMSKWLQGFAYRVPMHWWMFAAAAIAAAVIALLTVSFQSIKAAIANPITSLRSE